MGTVFTIIIFTLILIYSYFQIRKIYNTFKEGKCATCAHKNNCSKNEDTCDIKIPD